jgi:hypothetical protein
MKWILAADGHRLLQRLPNVRHHEPDRLGDRRNRGDGRWLNAFR